MGGKNVEKYGKNVDFHFKLCYKNTDTKNKEDIQ